MPYRDLYFTDEAKPSEAKTSSPIIIADPMARIHAQILDFAVVFAPLFALIAAPLKKNLVESYLLGNWNQILSLFGRMVFCFFAVYILVTIVSHLFFGNTLGKRILGVRVVDLWTYEPLSVWRHFIRSLILFFEIVCFGFPLALIFTNNRHRTLHDQIADSIVIRTKAQESPSSNYMFLRFFMRTALIIVIGLGLSLFFKVFHFAASWKGLNGFVESALNSKGTSSCVKVDDLEQAMSLVASGYMETPCLKDYVTIEFVDGAQPSSLAYLAKSFLHVDNPELSDKYLSKVCEVERDSAACLLSQFIANWSDGENDSLSEILEQGKRFKESFFNLWALRYYQQTGMYKKSLEFSKGLTADDKFGVYVQTQVLKAKYFLNDLKGSDEDLVRMSSGSDSPVVMDTLAWSCLKKISSSCEQATHPFCRAVSEDTDGAFQLRVELGKLRLNECSGSSEEPGGRIVGPSFWKDFVHGLMKERQGDTQSAWLIYSEVIKSEAPDFLKSEALRRMSVHPDLAKIEDLERLVLSVDSYEDRKEAANHVAQVFYQLDLVELAESVISEHGLENESRLDGERLPASTKGVFDEGGEETK